MEQSGVEQKERTVCRLDEQIENVREFMKWNDSEKQAEWNVLLAKQAELDPKTLVAEFGKAQLHAEGQIKRGIDASVWKAVVGNNMRGKPPRSTTNYTQAFKAMQEDPRLAFKDLDAFITHYTDLEGESYSLLQFCNTVEQEAFDLKSELRAVQEQCRNERDQIESNDQVGRRREEKGGCGGCCGVLWGAVGCCGVL